APKDPATTPSSAAGPNRSRASAWEGTASDKATAARMGIVRGRMTVLRPIAASHSTAEFWKSSPLRRPRQEAPKKDQRSGRRLSAAATRSCLGCVAMRRNAMIREIVAAAGDDTNASRDGPAIDEGTAMHASTHAALALLLLAAQGAHAQAPLPAGFVDAAAVVDGLVVDMRYFGANNFVGERIDGYEGPRWLLSGPAANALAAVGPDLHARGLGPTCVVC